MDKQHKILRSLLQELISAQDGITYIYERHQDHRGFFSSIKIAKAHRDLIIEEIVAYVDKLEMCDEI